MTLLKTMLFAERVLHSRFGNILAAMDIRVNFGFDPHLHNIPDGCTRLWEGVFRARGAR